MSNESVGCIVYLIVLIVVLCLGCVCFDYNLYFWFAKDVPWYVDAPVGLVLSECVIPLTLLTLVLDHCDYVSPFVGGE